MQKRWVRYETIEENRDGYYVVYDPVFTGNEFAILRVNIYEESLVNNVAEIMESELSIWASRYPVPIMVMFSDKTGAENSLKKVIGHDYLMGYRQNGMMHKFWDGYPDAENPNFDLSENKLSQIYEGLSFKTSEEVDRELREKGRANRALLIFFTFWFCFIPMLIAYLGWSNPIISLIALFYSWFIAIRKGLQMWGKKKKSKREQEQDDEKLQRDHHHYHCKMNPDGFLRLKAENFKKERLEKERAKIDSMKNSP